MAAADQPSRAFHSITVVCVMADICGAALGWSGGASAAAVVHGHASPLAWSCMEEHCE